MKLTQAEADEVTEPTRPPCSMCGAPSRAFAALFWGKHLCPAHEQSWMDHMDHEFDTNGKLDCEASVLFERWFQASKARAA